MLSDVRNSAPHDRYFALPLRARLVVDGNGWSSWAWWPGLPGREVQMELLLGLATVLGVLVPTGLLADWLKYRRRGFRR